MNERDLDLKTRAVRAGIENDRHYGAVIPPLHLSSTFTFSGLGYPRQHDYSRSGNPTRDLLADALCEMEAGAGACITATGMAAITVVLQLVEPGERLLAPSDCYGGTWRLIDALARRGAFEVEWIDFHDEQAWRSALATPSGMVWLESPTNPLLRLVDIGAICERARIAGARVIVDNTFLTPALQQPLRLGADIVVHSTTKYINGHSDVLGGAVICADAATAERVAWWANCLGLTGSAFDSWMTLRGLRTLEVRMRQHQENAHAVACLLDEHPATARVHYPGLEHHAQHSLAVRQQRGFGGIVSLDLAGGRPPVQRFLNGLRLFSLAESLGGVESLVAHPATMTHAAMGAEARRAAGIGEGLLRLSVGLESARDLCRDLSMALERAHCSEVLKV
ncbi:MAG TPA: cystathionine gamma-synthase [Wenzhouxiangellaceae bacterium]|nr:cystathionine gamma-synthase [Wenzhouxiangellaceae bacterium]